MLDKFVWFLLDRIDTSNKSKENDEHWEEIFFKKNSTMKESNVPLRSVAQPSARTQTHTHTHTSSDWIDNKYSITSSAPSSNPRSFPKASWSRIFGSPLPLPDIVVDCWVVDAGHYYSLLLHILRSEWTRVMRKSSVKSNKYFLDSSKKFLGDKFRTVLGPAWNGTHFTA